MTTEVIDVAFHGTSFPATYIGPGTIIGNPVVAASVVERLHGYFTSNGNAVSIKPGFRPLLIKVVNTTDGLVWEWQYGMPAANSIKTTLGGSLASVQDTSSQLALVDGGAGVFTLTLGATLCGTAKNITYCISG